MGNLLLLHFFQCGKYYAFFLFKPGRFSARHFSKETAQHLPFVNKEKCLKIGNSIQKQLKIQNHFLLCVSFALKTLKGKFQK
jgi:hypothetical protein